jgi:hypothetical protein
VTLAEIYAAQGHRTRAIETLDRVLAREPDHIAASALVGQLRDDTYPVPPPRLPPEEDEPALVEGDPSLEAEPAHMLDDAPLPPKYDVDECVAIPIDPRTLYVYWEVRDRTLDYVRAERPGGTVALRVVVVVPTWEGPRSSVRDHDVHATLGDYVVHDLPAGCVVRAAIGYRHGDAFVSVAHSPALDAPPEGPSPLAADALVRWTPRGAVRVSADDRESASIARALDRARSDRGVASLTGWDTSPRVESGALGGSSEKWGSAPSS